MIDLHQLEVLAAAAETGSVTAAAKRLGVTQSTASHHLSRLETIAGVELVIRQPRGVTLTEAGSALLAHGRAIVDRLAVAEAELADRRSARIGSFTIHSFATALIDLVPRAVRGLLKHGTQVRFDLAVGPRDEALAAVAEGAADLAITFSEGIEHPVAVGLERVELLQDPMMVVLPADHPLAAHEQVQLRDLAGARWVLSGRAGSDALTYQALRAEGIDPDVLVETSDLHAVHGMVAAGLGVALTPATALRHVRRDIAVRALSHPPLARSIEAIRRTSDHRDVTAELLHELRAVADTLA